MEKNSKYVAYLRVSTQRQGVSGLGLEAQRQMARCLNDDGFTTSRGSELVPLTVHKLIQRYNFKTGGGRWKF